MDYVHQERASSSLCISMPSSEIRRKTEIEVFKKISKYFRGYAAQSRHVWPLTQLFSVSFFGTKIIGLPEGPINDLLLGIYFSLPFLPATSSSRSWTLEGFFELTRCPHATCLMCSFQNYRDIRTLFRAWRGGPRTP